MKVGIFILFLARGACLVLLSMGKGCTAPTFGVKPFIFLCQALGAGPEVLLWTPCGLWDESLIFLWFFSLPIKQRSLLLLREL